MPDLDIAAVNEQALEEFEAIMDAVMDGLAAPKLAQEKLRAAFEQARQVPGGVEAFEAEFGLEEAIKQGVLLLNRREAE